MNLREYLTASDEEKNALRTKVLERDLTSIYKALKNEGINGRIVSPPYVAVPGTQQNRCFRNVARHCEHHEGEQVIGWAFGECLDWCIELVSHCVWRNPVGELIDITPVRGLVDQRYFIQDIKAMPVYYHGGWITPASKIVCLSKIKKHIRTVQAMNRKNKEDFQKDFLEYAATIDSIKKDVFHFGSNGPKFRLMVQ